VLRCRRTELTRTLRAEALTWSLRAETLALSLRTEGLSLTLRAEALTRHGRAPAAAAATPPPPSAVAVPLTLTAGPIAGRSGRASLLRGLARLRRAAVSGLAFVLIHGFTSFARGEKRSQRCPSLVSFTR
jgi:hypothetical protein